MDVVSQSTRPWTVVQKTRQPHKLKVEDEWKLEKSGVTTRMNGGLMVASVMNSSEQNNESLFIALDEENTEIVIDDQDTSRKKNNDQSIIGTKIETGDHNLNGLMDFQHMGAMKASNKKYKKRVHGKNIVKASCGIMKEKKGTCVARVRKILRK